MSNEISNKVYVGNLPYSATEDDLESLFSSFGNIVEIRLVYDRGTRRSKGFGFVEFSEPSSAESALTLTGQDFQGRPLKVALAREREREGGGDRGGNGGDRGENGGDRGGNGGGRSRW